MTTAWNEDAMRGAETPHASLLYAGAVQSQLPIHERSQRSTNDALEVMNSGMS